MEFEEIDILSVKFLCSKGCLVTSSINPEVTCKFPEGAVTCGEKSFCRVSTQVKNIDESLVLKHMEKGASVSPVVTLEPMKRRFHKQITLTIPIPGLKNKKTDKKNVRILYSITGSKDHFDWQDVPSGTWAKGLDGCRINISTVVTGMFVIVCCDNSIMDIPETVGEMLKSYMNGGSFGATNCQPSLDLLKAAKSGDLSALKACLDNEAVDINSQNKGGQTSLHLACKEGHTDIVEELLKRHADYKIFTKKGNAAIHLASYYGNTEVVQLLLDAGCDVNFSSKKIASECQAVWIQMRQLVTRCLILIQNVFNNNHTFDRSVQKDQICPLYPAILESHCSTVKLLLKHGGDMTWECQDGLPLPIVAVFSTYDREKISAILELLLQEVDITQFTISEQLKHRGFHNFGDAFLYCVKTRQATGDMLGPVRQTLANLSTELIQQEMASTETCRDDLRQFLAAVKEGNKERIVEMLTQDKFVTLTTESNISGLHCACLHGHTNIVAKLIERGLNVNLQTQRGFTCLYLAAVGGFTDIVNMLLKRGANIDVVNKYGLRAVDIATEMGHIDTLSALQEFYKAHPNRPTENGNYKAATVSDKELEKDDDKKKQGCCAF